MPTDSYDLTALGDSAGVSIRTIRYYIQQGLLPSPEARGPGAHYGREHLDRLRLIRRLQREHLPLAEIRRRLEALEPAEIRRLAAQGERHTAGSARDYVRRVLDGGGAPPSASMSAPMSAPMSASLAAPPAAPLSEASRNVPEARTTLGRAQWDRITLAPDVELHVRRPLSREQNRQVERLIDAARDIFEEDAS